MLFFTCNLTKQQNSRVLMGKKMRTIYLVKVLNLIRVHSN